MLVAAFISLFCNLVNLATLEQLNCGRKKENDSIDIENNFSSSEIQNFDFNRLEKNVGGKD